MKLKEAVSFWKSESLEGSHLDQPLAIDTESIPGWVIAIRRPLDGTDEPYVEIWTEHDFIQETEIHQSSREKVKNTA